MNTARVFIADYDEESLKRLTTVLRVAGFEVDSTRDGNKALEVIERFQPKVCLIDPMIPGVDGFTLSKKIRSRFPGIATVISTAIYKGDRYRRDARVRYGVSAYLEKPYSDEKLLEILARLVLPEQAKARGFSTPEEVTSNPPLPSYEDDVMDTTLGDGEELEAFDSEKADDVVKPVADPASTLSMDPAYLDPELQRMRDEWTAAKKAQESLDLSEPETDDEEADITLATSPGHENDLADNTVADLDMFEADPLEGTVSKLNFTTDPDADYIMAPPEMNPPAFGSISEKDEDEPDSEFLDLLSGLEKDEPEEVEPVPPVVQAPEPIAKEPHPVQKFSSADIFGSVIEEVEEKSGMWKILPDAKPPEKAAAEVSPPETRVEVATRPRAEPLKQEESPGKEEPPPLFEEDDELFIEEDDAERTDPDPLSLAINNQDELEDEDEGTYEFLELQSRDVVSEFWKAKRLGEGGFEKIITIRKVKAELDPDPTFVDLFAEEARVVANLNHPNIGQIYELGRLGGSQYIAQEYMEGKTLEAILRAWEIRGVVLAPDMAAHIGLKLCNALFYAHNQKDFDGTPLHISHGNFTPKNIFITHAGETKIIGFGMNASEALARSTLGEANNRDPRYLPEGQPYDQSADVYGLGVILYRAMTGAFPDRDAPQPPAERVASIPASLSEGVYSAIRPRAGSIRLSARELGNVLIHYFDEENNHLEDAELVARLERMDQPEPDQPQALPQPVQAPAPVQKIPEPRLTKPVEGVSKAKPRAGVSQKKLGKKMLVPIVLLGVLALFLLWFFTRPDPSPAPALVEDPPETALPTDSPDEKPEETTTPTPPPAKEGPSELELELEREKERARISGEKLEAMKREMKRKMELQKKDNE